MTSSLKNPSCYLYSPGVAKIEEAPYPTISDQHDVVIRIAYVGVCGSDVSNPSIQEYQHSDAAPGALLEPWRHWH